MGSSVRVAELLFLWQNISMSYKIDKPEKATRNPEILRNQNQTEKPKSPEDSQKDWDGKEDIGQYARRVRAKNVGEFLIAGSLERRSGEGKKNEAKDLGMILKESGGPTIEGFKGKKDAFSKMYGEMAKNFPDLAKAGKKIEGSLKRFDETERDLLLFSLENELNPVKKNPKTPEEKNKLLQASKVEKKFDAQIDSGQTGTGQKDAAHLAAFVYLKQLQINATEAQISDLAAKAKSAQKGLQTEERNCENLMRSKPLTDKLRKMAFDSKLKDSEKVRKIDDFLSSFEGKDREVSDAYLSAIQLAAAENSSKQIESLIKAAREMEEEIDRALSRFKMEQALEAAKIPPEKNEG